MTFIKSRIRVTRGKYLGKLGRVVKDLPDRKIKVKLDGINEKKTDEAFDMTLDDVIFVIT
jgi:ribosomal protein L24